MKSAWPSGGLRMDPTAPGSPLPSWPARTPASRESQSELHAPITSEAGFAFDLMATLDSSPGKDQLTTRQSALPPLSPVDAAAFIPLLQIVDPKPQDYRQRA